MSVSLGEDSLCNSSEHGFLCLAVRPNNTGRRTRCCCTFEGKLQCSSYSLQLFGKLKDDYREKKKESRCAQESLIAAALCICKNEFIQ